MTDPVVTVLMSVHNGASSLRATLESIGTQTFPALELLVIDDGSVDATPGILAAWPDPRLRVIRQERSGLTRSLRRGVELARAPLIARIDADDTAHPQRLARQVAFMRERPDVGLAGTWADVIDPSGRVLHRGRPPTDHDAISAQLLWDNAFFHSSLIFRADLVRSIGSYDDGIALAQDYDLAWRVGRVAQLANLAEPLIRWRRSPSAISVRQHEAQRASVGSTSLRALRETFPQMVDEERFWRIRRLWDGSTDRLVAGDGSHLARMVRLLPEAAGRTSWIELVGLVAAARRDEAWELLRAAWGSLPTARHRLLGTKIALRVLSGGLGIRAGRRLRRMVRGY